MKKAILMSMILAMVAISGCGSSLTESEQWAIASSSYTAVADVLSTMIEAGKIDYYEAQAIKKYSIIVNDALNSWYESIEAGTPTEEAKKDYNSAMYELDKIKKGR